MISDKIVEQVLLIRDSGKHNMLDVESIREEAYSRGNHELIAFLEENNEAYVDFIMTGKR